MLKQTSEWATMIMPLLAATLCFVNVVCDLATKEKWWKIASNFVVGCYLLYRFFT